MNIKKINYLNILIFLSAFLLFQIEPIISKILLPHFGGSYLVWGACVVFFQAALLLGYAYSYFILQRFSISRYRYFHLLLLILPLFFFPGKQLPAINSHLQIPMAIDIFGQLAVSIGLVFFVLSTTSIIFQAWLAASELPESSNPYILYAVSNLGSFVALFSYPFIFEAIIDLRQQLLIWRIGYFVLLLVHIVVLRRVKLRQDKVSSKPEIAKMRFGKEELSWLLLGAAGTIMFLSVTNIITYEVAPIPLLWVIPLSIYLVSFVLVFKKRPWCPQWIKEKFHVIIGLGVLFFFLTQKMIFPFLFEVFFYCIFLFVICMFCQSQLHARRPQQDSRLAAFYLIIAIGSFLGGVLTTWIMPLVSAGMVEYLIGLFFVSCVLIIDDKPRKLDWYRLRLVIYILIFITLWPAVFKGYNVFGMIIIISVFYIVFVQLKANPRMFNFGLVSIICCAELLEPLWVGHDFVYKRRNYYGIYKVYDYATKRLLANGTTLHGAQFLDPKKQKEPLTYFHRLTPVGELMTSALFTFPKTAVVGLGTGALSCYIKQDQRIDFFELDPDIELIANRYFTYLKNCSGEVNVFLGDARISLKDVADKYYSIIIIDAFSGDSIPIHLLTIEAISQYRRLISDKGIVLFHLSNRYLDLFPVLLANSEVLDAYACRRSNSQSADRNAFASEWAAFTWDKEVFNKLVNDLKWKHLGQNENKRFKPWTDNYSNLAAVLKFKIGILKDVKEFRPFYW